LDFNSFPAFFDFFLAGSLAWASDQANPAPKNRKNKKNKKTKKSRKNKKNKKCGCMNKNNVNLMVYLLTPES